MSDKVEVSFKYFIISFLSIFGLNDRQDASIPVNIQTALKLPDKLFQPSSKDWLVILGTEKIGLKLDTTLVNPSVVPMFITFSTSPGNNIKFWYLLYPAHKMDI